MWHQLQQDEGVWGRHPHSSFLHLPRPNFNSLSPFKPLSTVMPLPSPKIILCHLHFRHGQAALTWGRMSLVVFDSPGHGPGWPLPFLPDPCGFLCNSLTHFPYRQGIGQCVLWTQVQTDPGLVFWSTFMTLLLNFFGHWLKSQSINSFHFTTTPNLEWRAWSSWSISPLTSMINLVLF